MSFAALAASADSLTGGASSYPRPLWRVVVAGQDVTGKMLPRLMKLTLTECRSDEADQLDIELSDHDGKLALPARGATIRLSLGWASTGLVDKGTFVVDEVAFEGPPDTITLRARSADMKSALRTRTERSFHKQTIREIVETVAKAHQLTAVVGQRFANVKLQHIDQTNESDVAFLNRIGKRYDAVATIKDGKLLFVPTERGQTASGKDMPTLKLTRRDGDRIRFHMADRDTYTGVRALWQDKGSSVQRKVVAGAIGNAKTLRTVFASEADALDNARAEWQRLQRGVANLEMSLAYGRPDLSPQTKVLLPTVKSPINEMTWLIVKLTHSLDESGLTTRFEAETAEAADVRTREESGPDDLPAGDGAE
ncbi:contractile injection system protein, VgrG/Pvc8 family [Achromobacter sp. MYb9]|uniref:contractile injection system protein, VgrG/Pvc8 family n=1 Tax=Achromobacter sp. MYb9 TaxID=1827284 RepID=UPI001E4F61F4|nr:contractile injection system protein, VgrG/Pvc8 family [Achromobacter sp. MYb9]